MTENNQGNNINEYVIGFDLCNDYSLISCWDYIKKKPVTINPTGGFGGEQIPTVLAYDKSNNKWIAGEEAFKITDRETDVVKIANFVNMIGSTDNVKIGYQEYTDVELLSIFFKIILAFALGENKDAVVKQIMITTSNDNNKTMEVIASAVENAGIDAEKIFIQSHLESSVQYMLCKELVQRKAGLFELYEKGLKYYQVSIKNLVDPWEITVEQSDFSSFLNGTMISDRIKEYMVEIYKEAANTLSISEAEEQEIYKLYRNNRQDIFSKISNNEEAEVTFTTVNPPVVGKIEPQMLYKYLSEFDVQFDGISKEILHKNIVTTIFLTGSGMEVPWSTRTLQTLCAGRRVFQGQKLFSQGACFTVAQNCALTKKIDMVIIGDGILSKDFGICATNRFGEMIFVPILNAGTPWYNAKSTLAVIADDENQIKIQTRKPGAKEYDLTAIPLNNLPERPKKATKLGITMRCSSQSELIVEVADLGLGNIFPATGKRWEKKIQV